MRETGGFPRIGRFIPQSRPLGDSRTRRRASGDALLPPLKPPAVQLADPAAPQSADLHFEFAYQVPHGVDTGLPVWVSGLEATVGALIGRDTIRITAPKALAVGHRYGL